MDKCRFKLKTRLIGTYNLENILAAACIGSFFNVEKERIVGAIEKYTPTNNRSQLIETKSNTIILDAYNANPSSMRAAIENFNSSPVKSKLLILGDMLELGKDSLIEHAAIVNLLIDLKFDNVILVGEDFFKVKNEKFTFFQTILETESFLSKRNFKGFEILLKASRGIGLEKLVSLF